MKNILIGLMFAFCFLVAQAGTTSGTIQYIDIRQSDGLIYFMINGVNAGRPACAVMPYWMLGNINNNTPTVKQQLALLMQAAATGKMVNITGKGICGLWSDGEDVNDVQLVM
ncbi:hypothetical protein [Andreprevotia chitinilytica]|uniref:hypothetical protein n=1 Tax=Andreprevotia chitinilytica TaxID=396808 RepID=UPI0012EB09FA|nr:hypothetical protein [Andreprevotia chitinilytica]